VSTPSPHQPAPLATPEKVTRPKAIDTAFLLVLAGIVFGAIGAVVTTLLDHERIAELVRDALNRVGDPYNEGDVVRLIGTFRVGGAVVIMLIAGLLLLVALKMRAGKNWARITLTGFAVLEMINFLSAVSDSGAALDLFWSLAGLAFTVAAVIHLFQADSVKFFAEIKKRRR
jgi:hypothetical protein